MADTWNPDEMETTRRGGRWTPIVIIGSALALYWMMTRPAPALEGWKSDFKAAVAEAQAGHHKLLLAFHMPGCPPCNLMSRQVLGTPEVQAALEGFVAVRIDAERDHQTAARFGVRGTPTYIVTDSQGTPLSMTVGYLPVEGFVEFLKGATAPPPTAPATGSAPPAAP